MRIAITDANIFIDLIELSLINHLFQIDLEIHTTQAVLEELLDEQQELLQAFRDKKELTIRVFTDTEQQAMLEMKVNRGFSDADKTLLYIGQSSEMLLLTGERLMRNYFKKQGVEVRGIIWLFDNFVEKELCSPAVAIEKMEELLRMNPRLPKDECEKRLKNWKSKL